MEEIFSRSHPLVKQIVALHDMKHRRDARIFIAEGSRTVKTLLETNTQPVHLFATQEMVQKLGTKLHGISLVCVSSDVMKKMSPTTTPSGLLGIFPQPIAMPLATPLNSGIVLSNIADPGNMGTLIRSAAAMDVDAVIAIGGVDPWHHRVVQASAGTIGLIPIISCGWHELREAQKGLRLCALVVSGGSPINTLAKNDRRLLVIGSEAHGIPSEWLDTCDERITLHMPGKTESLNAAVAGSIALYLLHAQSD